MNQDSDFPAIIVLMVGLLSITTVICVTTYLVTKLNINCDKKDDYS